MIPKTRANYSTSRTRETGLLVAAIASSLLASQSLQAANKTWSATPATNDLAGANNYTTAGAPLTNDFLIFGTSNTTTLTNTLSAFTLAFQFNAGASAYSISGNSITLNNNITNNATATQTLNMDMALGANRNVATITGGTTVLGGSISGPAFRLQATGPGTLTLNGSTASTYTGLTSAAQGATLNLDFANLASGTNLVSSSSTLNFGDGNVPMTTSVNVLGRSSGATSQTFGALSLGTSGVGRLTLTPGGVGTSTTVNLGTGTSSRQANSVLNIDISSANGGTMTVVAPTSGLAVSNNVYGFITVTDAGGTGLAQVSGGNLVRLSGQTALADNSNSGTINYLYNSAGTLNWSNGITTRSINSLTIDTTAGANTIDLGAASNVLTIGSRAILVSGANAATLSGGQLAAAGQELTLHTIGTGGVTINSLLSSGAGTFTKSGADTVTITSSNTYTGATSINYGTVRAGAANIFSATSQLNMNGDTNAVFDLNGFNQNVGALQYGGLNTNVTSANLARILLTGGAILTTGGNNVSTGFYGVISGTGGLTKVGTGTQQLLAANTYTGATTVNGGVLMARSTSAFGVNSAVTVGASGTLDVFGNSMSVGSLSGSGVVQNGNASSVTLTTGGANTSTTFSGGVNNGPTIGTMILGLTKTGTGTQVLSGTNTYTGITTVTGGTLQFGKQVSLYNNTPASWVKTSIIVNTGATLAFNVGGTGEFTSSDIDTLQTNLKTSINNNGFRSGSSLGLDTTNASGGNFTYGTAIANSTGTGSGAVGLAKLGTNTLTLTGANTYTGATAVNGGTLLVNNTHTGAGAYTVNSGGTLGGNGAVTLANNTSITLASGGKLFPGASAVTAGETLTFTTSGSGTLDLTAGISGVNTGALVFDLGATADKIALTGLLTIGAGELEFTDFTFNNIGGLTAGSFTLFDTNTNISGSLGGVLSGSISGGFNGTLSIAANQDIVLTVTAVPEPGAWGLMGMGLVVLIVIRRRHLRRAM